MIVGWGWLIFAFMMLGTLFYFVMLVVFMVIIHRTVRRINMLDKGGSNAKELSDQ